MSDSRLNSNLTAYLLDKLTSNQVTVVCIGSDRYTGDCLGPLVGSMLEEANVGWRVIGTLDNPVHAGNLAEVVTTIPARETVIGIDACLGKAHEEGNIECWPGSIKPGLACGNKLPEVGDIAIFGVVNVQSHPGHLTLQSTPLSRVMKLSKIIAQALIDTHETMHREKVDRDCNYRGAARINRRYSKTAPDSPVLVFS